MTNDLSILNNTPAFETRATLAIATLAPLSMVSKMPGKYYTSSDGPTKPMIYGMLENALGWHIEPKERDALLKELEKKYKTKTGKTGVGFGSLLQWHMRINLIVVPPVMRYDDLWTQHLSGTSRMIGGSRNYDYEAIPIMNAIAGGFIPSPGDVAKANRAPEVIRDFKEGETVHVDVLKPYLPQYYSSPKLRGYVVPEGAYQVQLETSAELAAALEAAVQNPASPLYLGSNDSWVEIEWNNHG